MSQSNIQLESELKEQITKIYYSDNGSAWEPFENWDYEDIKDQIETDVIAMMQFINDKKKLLLNYLKG